ncbi:DUF551 domain-containing protein [Klebsiella pneumoniae]|nr:DUF551 domain-containing protein [Klebsiella pneumoniae]
MTSKLTRERIEQYANDPRMCNINDEIRQMARMALAAMDSEPAIADCDPEVYEKGVSVCLVAIPKETAEVICQNITAATGCKVDWHYFGGRVHIKALRESSQPSQVVPDEVTAEDCPALVKYDVNEVDEAWARGFNACRAAMLHAGNSPAQSDCCPAQNHVSPEQNGDTPAQSQGWIPVSERIPDNTEPVLCIEKRADFGTYGQPFVCWHDGGGWVGKTNYRPIVTHWMPLPAAPQEVK